MLDVAEAAAALGERLHHLLSHKQIIMGNAGKTKENKTGVARQGKRSLDERILKKLLLLLLFIFYHSTQQRHHSVSSR